MKKTTWKKILFEVGDNYNRYFLYTYINFKFYYNTKGWVKDEDSWGEFKQAQAHLLGLSSRRGVRAVFTGDG